MVKVLSYNMFVYHMHKDGVNSLICKKTKMLGEAAA